MRILGSSRWCVVAGGLVALVGCTPPDPIALGPLASPSSTAGPMSTAGPAFLPKEDPGMPSDRNPSHPFPVVKTDEEWRSLLTPEQFRITREKGTERAFTGAYWNTKTAGTYVCVCCDRQLFVSDAKFDSGCGWPSFFAAVDDTAIVTEDDYSILPARVEIMCANCGSHLGHVFEDGPPPTGLRFCVNSASVRLLPEEDAAPE